MFESRTDVFDKESVLQETMIFKLKKQQKHSPKVTISTTNGNGDFSKIHHFEAPYDTVVSPLTNYVYLPANKENLKVLKTISSFGNTLPSLGMKMKTDLVVDFRVPELLESEKSENNVPLFYSRHIKEGKVSFPGYQFISTQNKINFIDGEKELSECTVYGLYVLFNSTLYDSYYRILNGSTQINSTEVNAMPIPNMLQIQEMGRMLIKSKDFSEENCDEILQEACA